MSRNIKKIVRSSISEGVMQISGEHIDLAGTLSTVDATTPLSPSSKFTTSLLDIRDQEFISNIVLSHWDNILGPRILHVWNLPNHSAQHSTTLNQITSQTLSGEICRDVYNSHIDFKFYDLGKEEIFIAAFIFTGTGISGAGVHGLSVIIRKPQLQFYLNVHSLFVCCFKRIVGKFRIIMNKIDVPLEELYEQFSQMSKKCISTLSSLQSCTFPKTIKLSETYFCPSHHLDRDFLSRCISSHLTTFCHSYVIGEKEEHVNMMIKTLALFSSSQELLCSCLVSGLHAMTYHHDLWLQGDTLRPGKPELPVHDILFSQFPSTVINLMNREVKQSPKFTDHVIHSYDEHRNELIGLHYGDVEMDIPGGELFTEFDQADTLVHNLLDELDKLPADCGIREAYISQFMRVIQKKALCLIKYIEEETNYGACPYKHGTRKLRQDLCIMSDGDLKIILASAEKLKPGLYWFLFGNDNIGSRVNSPEYSQN